MDEHPEVFTLQGSMNKPEQQSVLEATPAESHCGQLALLPNAAAYLSHYRGDGGVKSLAGTPSPDP